LGAIHQIITAAERYFYVINFERSEKMGIYGESPHSEDDIPQLVGVQTNVAGYFFDAVLKVDHSNKLRLTSHPVESGASVTDHAFKEPRELTMEIGMSDVCTSFVDGQFAQKASRSVAAYDILTQLQDSLIPLKIYTRLCVYENMLIETIATPEDYKTLFGLRVTIGFREIIVAKTNTVAFTHRPRAPERAVPSGAQDSFSIPSFDIPSFDMPSIDIPEFSPVIPEPAPLPNNTSTAPQKTGSTNQGTVQPTQTQPRQSLLRSMVG
jgi:hypothetical protein